MVDHLNRPHSSVPCSAYGQAELIPADAQDPRFSMAITLVSALALAGSILFFVWLQFAVPPVERIASADRALALMVGRTMELDAALAGAPAWERWLHDITTDTGVDELALALTWYKELAASSNQPLVHLQMAVLEAEAGQLEQVHQKSRAWAHLADPYPFFARVLRGAYLEPRQGPTDELGLQAELAERIPASWFYDRLAISLAERAGDAALLSASQASLAARGDLLLGRIRILTAIELLLILAGLFGVLLLIMRIPQGLGTRFPVGTASIPPPWRGWVGMAVLVRGGALAVLISAVFLFIDIESPWLELSAMPIASLPLLVMAQRHLFKPKGLRLWQGLGLQPHRSGRRSFVPVSLALLAAGLLGEWGLGVLAEWLDLSTHWTEWFDPDLVWGNGPVLAMSLLEFVFFAPVLEEIVFRGLLFGTLRRRFGCGASAVFSASIFALAHGYGALGFASVFWSGMLWAWAYEKTGSLLPAILAHALNNLLVCMTIISFLR
jgi:membrane protease YdiL (CAAX protease family)